MAKWMTKRGLQAIKLRLQLRDKMSHNENEGCIDCAVMAELQALIEHDKMTNKRAEDVEKCECCGVVLYDDLEIEEGLCDMCRPFLVPGRDSH